MVSPDQGNLKSKVFFIWGGLCVICNIYAYFLVWETKGLTLEQVDRMMEEVGSPRKSPGWRPNASYAAEMGLNHDGKLPVETREKMQTGEKAHIAAGQQALHTETA